MRISASQVTTYEMCPTRWYINKVLKVDTPTSPAQQFGKDLHSAVENYLKERTIPDESADPRIRALLSNAEPILNNIIDKAGDTLEVEKEITGPIIGGTTYLGYIDVLAVIDGYALIADHKNSSSSKWFKSEYQLAKDVQMNLYANHCFENLEDIAGVQTMHIQYLRGSPFTVTTTSHLIDPDECSKQFVRIQKVAVEMKEIVDEVGGNWLRASTSVPRISKSCMAFGGCPFKPICHRGVKPENLFCEEKMPLPKSTPFKEGNSNMNILEKLRAEKNGTQAEEPKKEEEVTDEKLQAIAARRRAKRETAKSEAPEAPEAPKAPKRKRRTKAEIEATEAVASENIKAAGGSEAVTVSAGSGVMVGYTSTALPKTVCTGAIFFFWCCPSRGLVTDLREIIKPWVEQIEKKHQVGDIRLVQYNEGIKDICTFKGQIMEECNKHTFILVDERDPVQQTIMQAMDLTNNLCIRSFSR